MAAQFATIEEFYDFIGVNPPDGRDDLALNAALRRASNNIRKIVRLARVAYDTNGFPTRSSIREGFAEATSAMLAATGAVDEDGQVDLEALGSGSPWSSVSLIGVSFSKGGPRGGGAASTGPELPPGYAEALTILGNLGIFTTAVRH